MTITLYTGRQNSGKTLGLALKTFKDFLNGRTIYSNTYLSFPHILINKDFILDIVEKGISLKDASILLDEAWLWIDSRKRDTTMSYFYLQSSKDNLNVNLSAQTDRQIDIRLRENLHYWGECERIILINNKLYNLPRKYEEKRKDLPKFLQERLIIKISLYTPLNSRQRNITFDDFELYKEIIIPAKQFYCLFNTESKIKLKVN